MIDPGSTCSIINYPTYQELEKLGQKMTIYRSKIKAKTYNGSDIRLFGHTSIQSCFDTDGKYPSNHKVWITEEITANLLGVDFCHLFLKALYFDIPAVELNSKGVISYGLMNNDKEYPNVSKIVSINLKEPLFIPARSTYLYKHLAEPNSYFEKGTTFLPHKNTTKTELVFINTVCTQIEQSLPILIENQKDHPVTLNKCVLGYAVTDIQGDEDKIFAIHDCDEFTTRILNESSEFDSCFMLNTVVNTTQESNTQLSGPCLQYVDFKKRSIFESNMPIAHTISADRAMKKGFAESISKRYPELRHFCNSIHANINDILIFTDPKSGQIIYNLITKQRYFQKPTSDAIFNTLSEMKDHAIANNIRSIAMPKIACGFDKMNWEEVSKIIVDVFQHSGITIFVYVSGQEIKDMSALEVFDTENVSEIFEQIGSDIVKVCKNENEIATDFSNDAKNLCRPPLKEQFKKYRNKEHNDRLIAFLVNETFTQYSSIDKDNSSTLEKIETTIKFLSDFDFTQSDISDDEFADLIQMLIEDQDVYSHHKYDIGKTKHKFHIPLKKDATFKKQRPSKIPVHLRDKLDKLMDELIQAGIVRELNEKDDMNSWFVNPVIILPKKDYVKLVLDARYLNSITDTSNCSWPLEPLQVLMTRINGSYFTSSDLSCAYHQVPLTDEAQKLTSFIVGGRQYTYQVGFYGLKPLSNFFSKLMRYAFGPLIKEKKAITYIDDTLLQSQTKNEMFGTIREYHSLLRKVNLKAAPDKTFFFLRKVKFLGHVVSKDGLSPIASRIDDIKKLKSPESKTVVLGVIGVMGFFSTYIINFHVDAKCLYELANSSDKFQ